MMLDTVLGISRADGRKRPTRSPTYTSPMAAHGAKAGRLPRYDTEHVAHVLSAVPLFRGLSGESISTVARTGRTIGYRRGQTICHQGDQGDSLYVVIDGLVEVTFTTERGDEIVLNTMGTTGVFGELAVLDGSQRSASVVALEATSGFMLARTVLLELARKHPSLVDEFLRMLGQLVRRLTEQAGDLASLDLTGRLAKLLLELAGKHGQSGGLVLDHGLTQSDLAAMIGASRPAVNRALQSLVVQGFVAVDSHAIVIRDAGALRKCAGL